MEISYPSGKIPIHVLENYSYCNKQGILSLRPKDSEKKVSKKRMIGIILHDVFKVLHDEWTDACYAGRLKQFHSNRMKMILEAAMDEARIVMENYPSFLKYKAELENGFRRMMEGRNGFISKINQAARELAGSNETFQADELPRAYFGGDPKFEWEMGLNHPELYGRADVVVEREEDKEFFIWEFKTGRVPDEPYESHVMEASGYAVVNEVETGMKCVSLKILYYGEKVSNIPFSEIHREKVKKKTREIFDYQENGEVPHTIMDKKCKECEYYEECDEESKVIHMEEIEGELTDPFDVLFPTEEESIDSEPLSIKASATEPVVPEHLPAHLAPLDVDVSIEDSSSSEGSAVPIVDAKEDMIPSDAIGIVIQKEKSEYTLSLDKDNILKGAIKQEFQRKIFPGQVLITKNDKVKSFPNQNLTILRKILKLK